TFQRAGEHIFGLGFVAGTGGGHGAVACVDDGLESAFLVSGVAFDGLDEVGNEIVAALELHVDVGPGVVALHFEAGPAVVDSDSDKNEQDDSAENDPADHGKTSREAKYMRTGDDANIRGAGASVKRGSVGCRT